MVALLIAVYHVLSLVWILILAHLLMSLLLRVGVLNYDRLWVQRLWHRLTGVLNPVYLPFRRVLPGGGPVDLAPVLALFAILGLQLLVLGAAALPA